MVARVLLFTAILGIHRPELPLLLQRGYTSETTSILRSFGICGSSPFIR